MIPEPDALTTHPAAGQFRHALEAAQADMLAVISEHERTGGPHLVVLALVEVCGVMAERLIEADPAAHVHLVSRFHELQRHIAWVGALPDETRH